MADFVAVIRRAVDGLSDNTPEMRAKVYEKARGAVRRQLENMKPRPNDVMFDRQLNKLESAIGEVEAEHAEALPSDAAETASVPAPAILADVFADPEPQPQSVEDHAEPDTTDPDTAEPGRDVEDHSPAQDVADVSQPEADSDDHRPSNEPAPEPHFVEHDDEPEPVASVAVAAEQPVHDDIWYGERKEPEPVIQTEAVPTAEPAGHDPFVEPAPADDDRAFERYSGEDDVGTGSAFPTVSPDEKEQPAAVWDLSEWSGRTQEADGPVVAVPDEIYRDDAAPSFPADDANVSTPGNESWSWTNDDPFDKRLDDGVDAATPAVEASSWAWPVEKRAEPTAEPEQKTAAWSELEDLIGYTGKGAAAGAGPSPSEDLPEVREPSPYAAEKRRTRFNVMPLLIGLVLIAVLAGGGYGYWQNQDKVNGWVSDIMAAVMPADTAPAPSDAGTTPSTDTPVPATDAAADGNAAQPEVAAVEGTPKFTQRLQPDGTEIDPGPAGQVNGDGTVEGTTVAAQTDAGSRQADNAAAAAAAVEGGDPTVETSGQTEQAEQTANAQAPVGVTQKMFLYEEKLGQAAPIAVEGTVVWSVKEESPGGDAKPEPAIQAQINVPDRGLTALVTIKRNADTSLPASHIIEFVFSLPESFEGGGIDSVQRVAMKQTEQDRGDALIAVPAKITDDFHMIALNDFAEAVTRNIELLRSRNWIDIPLTYRNGRRALITMEKGTTGIEAFNTVMRNWSTLAKPAATSQ